MRNIWTNLPASRIKRLFVFGTLVQIGFLMLVITIYLNSWVLIPETLPYSVKRVFSEHTNSKASTLQPTYDYCKPNKSSPTYKSPPILSISKLKVPAFLKDYKNPCWKDEHEGHVLCVPYFYLAGFPKCGTSDLYSRLLAHPLIVSPRWKEIHYLSRRAFYSSRCWKQLMLNATGSETCVIRWYAKRFIGTAAWDIKNNVKSVELESKVRMKQNAHQREEDKYLGYSKYTIKYLSERFQTEWDFIRKKAAESWKHPMITIDGSASSIWDNTHWYQIEDNFGCTEPPYIIPDLMLKINPNPYIIVLLREPAQRTYSDFLYFSGYSLTKEDFHNRTVNAIGQFEACLKKDSLRHCTLELKNGNDAGRVRPHISLYHVYIEEWLRRIPRERFLFLRTETYGANIPETLKRVFEFLQLPPLSFGAMEAIQQQTRFLRNPHKIPMMPETHLLLKNFYEEHNRKLAELLGDDSFLWKDWNPGRKKPGAGALYEGY